MSRPAKPSKKIIFHLLPNIQTEYGSNTNTKTEIGSIKLNWHPIPFASVRNIAAALLKPPIDHNSFLLYYNTDSEFEQTNPQLHVFPSTNLQSLDNRHQPGNIHIFIVPSNSLVRLAPTTETYSLRFLSQGTSGRRKGGFAQLVKNRDLGCCITGEMLEYEDDMEEEAAWRGIEAIHIFPLAFARHWEDRDYHHYITDMPPNASPAVKLNSSQNGMMVSADIHTLWDAYEIGIDVDAGYRIISFGFSQKYQTWRDRSLAVWARENGNVGVRDELLRWHFQTCVLANVKARSPDSLERYHHPHAGLRLTQRRFNTLQMEFMDPGNTFDNSQGERAEFFAIAMAALLEQVIVERKEAEELGNAQPDLFSSKDPSSECSKPLPSARLYLGRPSELTLYHDTGSPVRFGGSSPSTSIKSSGNHNQWKEDEYGSNGTLTDASSPCPSPSQSIKEDTLIPVHLVPSTLSLFEPSTPKVAPTPESHPLHAIKKCTAPQTTHDLKASTQPSRKYRKVQAKTSVRKDLQRRYCAISRDRKKGL